MPRESNPEGPSDGPPPRPQRVVGVIQDFRQFGEYSTPVNYMFVRNDIVSAAAAPAAPAAPVSGTAAAGSTPREGDSAPPAAAATWIVWTPGSPMPWSSAYVQA